MAFHGDGERRKEKERNKRNKKKKRITGKDVWAERKREKNERKVRL